PFTMRLTLTIRSSPTDSFAHSPRVTDARAAGRARRHAGADLRLQTGDLSRAWRLGTLSAAGQPLAETAGSDHAAGHRSAGDGLRADGPAAALGAGDGR